MNKKLLVLAGGAGIDRRRGAFCEKAGCRREMKGRWKGTEWPPENGRL